MTLFKSRRNVDKVSVMPAILCIMLTGIVSSLTYILCFVDVPTGSKEVLLIVVGIVCGEWKNSVGYWLQNTKSSEDKTKLLANSIPANARREDDDNGQN